MSHLSKGSALAPVTLLADGLVGNLNWPRTFWSSHFFIFILIVFLSYLLALCLLSEMQDD